MRASARAAKRARQVRRAKKAQQARVARQRVAAALRGGRRMRRALFSAKGKVAARYANEQIAMRRAMARRVS